MIDTYKFGYALKEAGFDFYSGVPCSYLKNLINYAVNDCDYYMAANEGDAVALCAGAYIGGRKPVFLCQNSGLTNAVSPLTSLNYIFKIPVLGFVSLRGGPGIKDEPQHELMGEITGDLLDLMKIKNERLSLDSAEWPYQLARANECIEKNDPFFFIIEKNSFYNVELKVRELKSNELKTGPLNNRVSIKSDITATADNRDVFRRLDNICYNDLRHNIEFKVLRPPKRLDALKIISKFADSKTIFIAATGKTGREFHDLCDCENNFYMVGSMGCVSSIALGLAVSRPDIDVIAIDGDGALLMRMGAMATAGFYSPANMLHILLDNHSHASTGGQFTVSPGVDFEAIAAACGYKNVYTAAGSDQLEKYIIDWKSFRGLSFVRFLIDSSESGEPGRPGLLPRQVKERLMEFIKNINR